MIKQFVIKNKFDTIEVMISNSLIDSYVSHNKLVPVNNVLREDMEIKEEIKYPENSVKYAI